MAMCDGDTGAYPGDCYSTAEWSVTSDTTDHDFYACNVHVGQVTQTIALRQALDELIIRAIKK